MKVLIAPLDWGLGHATRCIPVIGELQRQGCEVVIAGSGDSLQLLQKEFQQLRSFAIPGYQPRYPAHGSMVLTMALQLPGFLRVISAEHRAINKITEIEKPDLIISDNRYGCRSPAIPSVFITHQSNILMPKRFGWLQYPVRRANIRMINRFNVCWIPDFPGDDSLAGDMHSSGDSPLKIEVEYIGWLSRFACPGGEKQKNSFHKYDIAAIFSGPEPQRTILENIVVPQLKPSGLKYRVVRGLPGLNSPEQDKSIVNFLPSRELQADIEGADLIVARSGYSTVMDMYALNRKVVFVPTPGQTEQEYLAKRFMEKGIAFYMKQNEFHLKTALDQAKNFSGFGAFPKNNLLQAAVAKAISMRGT
ncbi:MAG: glycosyltransferase [Cyclobacteriaceae bacterium]